MNFLISFLIFLLFAGDARAQFASQDQWWLIKSGNVTSPIKLTVTDPDVNADANDRAGVRFNCTTTSATSNPNFSNEDCLEIVQNIQHGQNSYGSGTNAKKTFLPLAITTTATGAGQRFNLSNALTCYGMGDCFGSSQRVIFAGADIAGDEGQGFQAISYLLQQSNLTITQVNNVPAQTTCNTTITQDVTASRTAQLVTVASSTNCNVNDWVVLGQAVNNGSPNISAVKITASAAGSITGIFVNNYTSGATVTPAKVLVLDSGSQLGQDRVLVNLSGASYSTGTISATAGGGMDGSGTTWANNMVGGTVTNVGCIALTPDDYSGAPFNGSGSTGTLKSWYEIAQITTTTHLAIHSFSVAGDVSYRGKGPGAGGYIVRPCARILRVEGTTVILETTATTWTAADFVEQAISPYPDVSGLQYRIAGYTPGGTYRSFLDIRNSGSRTFEAGIQLLGLMQTGSNSDYPIAWETGLAIDLADTGVSVIRNKGRAFIAGTSASAPFSETTKFTFSGINFGGGTGGYGLQGNGTTTDVDLLGDNGNIIINLEASSGNIKLTPKSGSFVNILSQKSSSGTRFLCIDSNGNVTSSPVACAGT